MKRSLSLVAIVVLSWVGLAGQAAAGSSKLAGAMGNLRWGISESDTIRLVQSSLKEKYGAKIKKARGSKKASLTAELKRAIKEVKGSRIEFEGNRVSWDSSQLAGEYTHGNYESMVSLEAGGSKNYYFFINGSLWKWVKVIDAAKFGGKNFKKFEKAVSKRFGRGTVKDGARLEGVNVAQRWVEFLDRGTRLRAVDEASTYGTYALVFEHRDTVRDLATLRTGTIERKMTHRGGSAVASSGSSKRQDVVAKVTGKSKKRRSIFAEEAEEESQADYKRRVKREEAQQRAKQRRTHNRKQRKSKRKSSAIDSVGSSDDNDPLGGL